MKEKMEDHAARVFLLMGKEYRISRSIRAQWFFEHINSAVYPKSDQELLSSHDELEVLSVLPEASHIHGVQSFRLAPSTKITFIGRQYRFVFCLDISPSEATLNVGTGRMLVEEVFDNFMNCVMGLVEPFIVPGSNLLLQPELVLTVLAHTPFVSKTCQVLVQGYCASQDNVYDLLYEVKSKLQTLEDYMASELTRKYEKRVFSEADFDENDIPLHDPESGLFMMIRDALLALQLLPDNASAGLVIVTDGVFSLNDASVVDTVLAQMRASTVVCSFLQVGNGPQFTANGFGYIPHTALMQFIAKATSGAYLCSCPKVNTTGLRQRSTSTEITGAQPMNIYHEALFCWNFHTDADKEKIESKNALDKLWINRTTYNNAGEMKRFMNSQPIQKIKHAELNYQTRIASVLSVRLREGYSIENVAITKDGTQLEVKLTLPWKEHVFIEYIAKAAWPLEQANRLTHVDVYIGGSYDFLVDIMSKQKFSSSYRKTVVHRFEQTMKSLQATDELLVRLQFFSVNPAYTTVPDSAKNGIPLFHLPQNSKAPVLSMQYGRSKKSAKSQEAQFVEFWRPILHLDTKTWQKWFHCHRVSLLLENDRPISKSLFLTSSNDYYQSVHCRTALNALNRMLRDWSSFVLLENHSYIMFLRKSNQRTPYSFCLLRLVFKGLCVVIRLAFLGGTAGTERQRIVSELKDSLREIKAPLKKTLFSPEHTLADSPPKSVILTTKDKHCVSFLARPLERILVKYDNVPEDLKLMEVKANGNDRVLDTSQSSQRYTPVTITGGSVPAKRSAILEALSCYMYNQRWIWKMCCNSNPLSMASVAGILYALTKRRLMEGFHFCSSISGIITMAKEIPIKRPSCDVILSEDVCVLQYVLFSPHQRIRIKDGYNEESIESETLVEQKGELQIVTEVWVEPQSGVVHANEAALQYLNGLTYNEIPKQMYKSDNEIVKELVTYAHLENMCNDSLLVSVPSCFGSEVEPPSDCFQTPSVVEIPFLFDVVALLKKSTQIFMLLPLLQQELSGEKDPEQNPNNILLSLFFTYLSELNDCEIPLQKDDCLAFSQFLSNRNAGKAGQDVYDCYTSLFEKQSSSTLTWKCFAGSAKKSLILIFVPASIEDLEKLTDTGIMHRSEDADVALQKMEEKDMVDARQKESTHYDEIGSNEQNYSKQNDNEDGRKDKVLLSNHHCLPVFIFECNFSSLSDIQPNAPPTRDLFLDYSSKLSENIAPSSDRPDATEAMIQDIGKSLVLSSYCKILVERYFQTFVNGVFKNLQLCNSLDSRDVESSVESICEESCLEVDITRFIRILCTHYRSEKIDDEVFGCSLEENFVIRRCGKLSSGSTVKTPRSPSSINMKCGNETVHKFVQDSFLEILQKKFKNVPNNDDLFFYHSDEDQIDKGDQTPSEADSDLHGPEMQDIDEIYEPVAQFSNLRETTQYDTDDTDNTDVMTNLSRMSIKGSTCAMSELESENAVSDLGSLASDENEDDSQSHPLFLHLTCSLRNKNQSSSDMALLPVKTLPTCLGEIISLLEEGSTLDPCSASLRVTLDLICLTLPPEIDGSKHWKSTDESTSTRAASDIDEDFLVDNGDGIAEDQLRQGVFDFREEKPVVPAAQRENVSTLIDNAITDPLKALPKSQLNAIKMIVRKIEWLLKDEIASALRNTSPVTEITLDNVADHVKNSATDNCQFRRIPLRFVCGMDKSLQLFLDVLSKVEIDNYHLRKRGKYYYLAGSKTSSDDDDERRQQGDDAEMSVTESCGIDEERPKANEEMGKEMHLDLSMQKDHVYLPENNELQQAENCMKVLLDSARVDGTDDHVIDDNGIDDHGIDDHRIDKVLESQEENEEVFDSTPCMRSDFEYFHDLIVDAIEEAIEATGSRISSPSSRIEHRTNSFSHPDQEKSFVRRRYSDPGVSTSHEMMLSLKSDDVSSYSKINDSHVSTDPDFWLLARIEGSEVMVFFHRRREAIDSQHSEKCYINLLSLIDKNGRIVNQKLLLDDLYETFTCHNLLVAEEEELIWSRRETSPAKALFITAKSEMGMPFEFSSVVHGEFEYKPGHFECDQVWETFLPVHYRLKRSPGQPKGTSRAMQAVRSVLDRFAVSNRSNLFVYRESSGNVFYFRINEDADAPLTSNSVRQTEDDQIKEENFSYQSAASSSWSLPGKVQQEATQENQEDIEHTKNVEVKLHRTSSILTQPEKDSVSELSIAGYNVMSMQRIQFCVHGICDPGKEIKDELVRVLVNKLDDAVFEQLNLLIARNPKCRLAPADVQFIQPPEQPPASVICIDLPEIALPFTHPMMFYLRQNLLQRFHTPRFTETSPDFHFKNYTGKVSNFASAEALSLNDLYLYNRREKKGFGIGCIHVSLIDHEQKEVIVSPAQQRVRPEVWENKLYVNTLKDLINVQVISEITPNNVDEVFVQFKIWERGNIGIEEMRTFLISDVKRALCDVFLEYFILVTPLSEVPVQYHYQYASTGSSVSSFSPTTSPALVKYTSRSSVPVASTPFTQISRGSKKFLSEPGTPAERRSRSPAEILRNRSINEVSLKESHSRKSSEDSSREPTRKQVVGSLEKTYETLEDLFPLSKSEILKAESQISKQSDNESTSVKDSESNSYESVSVIDEGKLLPDSRATDSQPVLGSPYDTLTDREVEESFNATLPGNDGKKELVWHEIEHRRRRDKDGRKLRRKYERGEIGFLHPCYHSGIEDVLCEVIDNGAIAVHKHEGSLKSWFSSDLVLKEILKIFGDIFPDAKPHVFRQASSFSCTEQDGKDSTVFLPYHFDRNAVKSDDVLETSTDSADKCHQFSLVPGRENNFVAVGRNVCQWRHSINFNEAISDEEEKSATKCSSKQQFKPFSCENSSMHSSGKPVDTVAPSFIKPAFIPRQKFYLVKLSHKKIITYTYNFPSEVNFQLDKQLTRLYSWHAARMHLASCLSMQKLGLFHHLQFTEETHDDTETSQFCSSVNHSHIISLVKETAPPSREKTKLSNTELSVPMPEFDSTLRDSAPSRPLHKATYKSTADPVKKVGHQYQEITKLKIYRASQQAKLKEILTMWHNCGPHVPVYENRLHLLKRYSHFIHFCQTPLLFNACSKERALAESEPRKEEMKGTKPEGSSFSSEKVSDESNSNESHDWFRELKWTVMQKYIQYLQTLGFCLIHLQSNSKSQQGKSTLKRLPSKTNTEVSARNRPHFMQKSVNAGILLLEISYRGDNLFLKIFAFEASRLKTLERCISVQETWMFLEDCMKYKDLMHLHSFSYDLHLRQAQQFLSGRNMIFYPGYPVQKLLQGMIKEFPKPPAYSCCYLAEGTVSIPCSAELETKEVFKYLTINAERYKMNPAKITKINDSELNDQSIDQTILSYMYHTSRTQDIKEMASSSRRDAADFDGNVVITLSPSQDNEVLNLTFFLILTNRREFYPRRCLRGPLSSLRHKRKRTFSGSDKTLLSTSDENQGSGPTKLRVRFSTRTSSNSFSDETDNQNVPLGPLKAPTWPTLHQCDITNEAKSPSQISSPCSDTVLVTAKEHSNFLPFGQMQLRPSSSEELSIRRSSSNEAISSTHVAAQYIKKSSSYGQLSDSTEIADSNFLANEVAIVSSRLSKVASTCLSNCWRDLVWYQLLSMDSVDEDSSNKKQKKKPEPKKERPQDVFTSNWKLTKTLCSIRKNITSKISQAEMKLLLGLVKVYSICDIDKSMTAVFTLMGNSRCQRDGALRALKSKFGNSYREFSFEDSRASYLCILNQKDPDMFILIITNIEGIIQDIQVVYREQPRVLPTATAEYSKLNEKERAGVDHIENVISCVSYNLWTQLLPNS